MNVGMCVFQSTLFYLSPGNLGTVDGRNPFRTTSETLEGFDSPVNTNKEWLLMVSKWCEMDFVHPPYLRSKVP